MAVHGISVVMLATAPLYLVQVLMQGAHVSVLFIVLNALVTLVALFGYARRGRVEVAGHLITGSILVSVSVGMLQAGGLRSPGGAWLLSVPICGSMLTTARGGVAWSLATLVAGTALVFAEAHGWLTATMEFADYPETYIWLDFSVLILMNTMMLAAYASSERAIGEELATSNHRLRREVEARAASEEAALAAMRVRSTFLATMSHEIRTPLNGLLGLTRLMLDAEPGDQRELAHAAHRSSELLHGLLDDILDFAKIDAGRLTLEEVSFDVCALCEDVVEVWSPLAAERGLTLVLEVAPGAPRWILGDPTRMRQVVGNLLNNGLKFTEEGGLVLKLSASEGSVVLRVVDSGIGMLPETASRVFDPFSQADVSTTRHYGGTGLGLAICATIAEAMGGSLSVASALGEGSTFELRIPWQVAAPVESTLSDDPRDLSVLEGCVVLVAEDNPVNQMVIRRQLQRLGVDAIVVGDGRACVDRWRTGSAQLILMDCNMPGCDGYAATTEIRALGGSLPIVALTANTLAADVQRCFDVGMSGYLPKPLRAEDLEDALMQWLVPDPEPALAVSA